MSTPCNSLNVQLIKVSQLANYSSLKDADQLMIVENTGGAKFSRVSLLSGLRSYILNGGLSGFPNSSFETNTDSNNLNYYTSGGTFSYSHNLGSIPSLVKAVLFCNSNDGFFATNDEIDISGCFNNTLKPFSNVVSNISQIKIIIPAFSSVYVYNPISPPAQLSLNKLNWQLKIYAWK